MADEQVVTHQIHCPHFLVVDGECTDCGATGTEVQPYRVTGYEGRKLMSEIMKWEGPLDEPVG